MLSIDFAVSGLLGQNRHTPISFRVTVPGAKLTISAPPPSARILGRRLWRTARTFSSKVD
jgi:hypothetical protein